MSVRHHANVVYTSVPGYRPLALDLHVGDAPKAWCVFLHGGGWRLGSRRDGPGPVGPDSQRFFHRMAERGLAVASVDYRLSGEARHPAQLDDVVAACEFLAQHLGDHIGESAVGELPLTLWGVSAGAHLAGLVALASPVGERVAAVVSWSAPSDLVALPDDVERIGGAGDRGSESRESRLLGAPTGEYPDRARAASPIEHVHTTATAFQIVHGTADEHVPIAQSERYAAALESAGATVETVFVEHADHFFGTVTPGRLAAVVDRSIDFLLRAATNAAVHAPTDGALVTPVWIGPHEPEVARPGDRPAYWLRSEFAVGDGDHALLRFSARGLVEIYINGTRIGDELMPGFMQYEQRLPLRHYDVTEAVRAGTNALVIMVADGWFRGQTGATRAADQWGTATSVWAALEIDGHAVVVTDPEWRSTPSHVLRADLIAGQTEDRRRFAPEILVPGFDMSSWHRVVVAEAPKAALVVDDAVPVRRIEELAPVAITEPQPGVQVVDFGQNFNGWTRLSSLGPVGTEITLTHGEWLDQDGDLTTDHLMVDFPFLPHPLAAGQIDAVVSAGRAGDVFEPRCTTHGFRYVRIEGHPGPLGADDVRGVVVHSDLRRIGWFECDDERVNRLHDAAAWSLRSNICEIPTDCPHRERAGWTGDWQIFAPTAAFLYDVDAFSRKWLADVRLAQRADGLIANLAPSSPAEGFGGPTAALHGSAGWGDVIVLAPWALYEAYGDPDPLRECWDSMERWVAYAAGAARDGRSAARSESRPLPAPHERYLWDTGFHWGEWLEPGVEVGDFAAFVAADKGQVATAYLHRSAAVMAMVAEVLGKSDAVVAHHRTVAAGALDAWQREYIRDDGRLVVQTQASHVRALAFGLVPDALRSATSDRLAELVRAAGTTVGTGFLSTGMLLPVLADHGQLDLAFELLLQPRAPGWMYMIDRGATTVWERWDGVDERGVPHDSLNHYSKAAVVSFLHRYTAGLTPTAPGYRTFEVRPRPGGGLTHVTQRLDSPHGPIEIDWRMTAPTVRLRVSVPPGTEASIILPNGEHHVARPGRHEWACDVP